MSATRTPSLSRVTINKTIACYFSLGSHFGLYNGSNPCPVQFPEAGPSQFDPLTSRSTPLHHQFAQPLHSSSVSSQPSVAGPPVAPSFGQETLSPAPWQSNIGSTVSSAPGFARSGTPYYFSPTLPRYVGTCDPYPTYPNQIRSFDHAMVIGPGSNPCSVGYPLFFPLRCRVMWGLVTPTPLLRIKLVRLTMRWCSALGLTLAQSGTPYFSPTLPRYVRTRDPYPTSPNQNRSFDHAMVIGPGFNPCSVRHPLFFPYVAALCGDS